MLHFSLKINLLFIANACKCSKKHKNVVTQTAQISNSRLNTIFAKNKLQ